MRRIKFELKGLRVLKDLQKPLEAKTGGKFPPLITLDGSDKGKKQRHVKLSSDRNYQWPFLESPTRHKTLDKKEGWEDRIGKQYKQSTLKQGKHETGQQYGKNFTIWLNGTICWGGHDPHCIFWKRKIKRKRHTEYSFLMELFHFTWKQLYKELSRWNIKPWSYKISVVVSVNWQKIKSVFRHPGIPSNISFISEASWDDPRWRRITDRTSNSVNIWLWWWEKKGIVITVSYYKSK